MRTPPSAPPFLRRRSTLVWFALVAATALSWWIGTHSFGSDDPRVAGMVVIAIGFVKARYVALDFMELRDAPLALRLVMTAWLVAAFAIIAALFMGGGG